MNHYGDEQRGAATASGADWDACAGRTQRFIAGRTRSGRAVPTDLDSGATPVGPDTPRP